MARLLWIAKRDLEAQLESPVACVIVVLFLLISGSLFWLPFFDEASPLSMRSFFMQAPLVLSFFVPAMTMGSFASEDRSGTLQLMMTLPVSEWELVLGKFLSAFSLLIIVCSLTLAYPLTLSLLAGSQGAAFDWSATIVGYAGLVGLGASYTALGVMASSWTRDHVVAILTSFTLCFALYLLDQLAGQGSTSTTATLITQLSATSHMRAISRGVISLSDLAYFTGLTLFALSIARASLIARRSS